MSKYFIGIDPSLTGTGIIVLNDKCEIVYQDLICTKKDDKQIHDTERRIIEIKNKLFFIKEYDKPLICIEDLSYMSKGQIVQLAALNYFIRIFLYENDIEYYTIAPTTLKKFVTGKGQSKKELILKEVYKKWGVDFSDNNLCDAYVLARYLLDK